MVGWFDLLYSILPLETGQTYTLNSLYPEDMAIVETVIEVRPDKLLVETEGQIISYFVSNVPQLNEIHRIYENGQLVMVEKRERDVTIHLIEITDPPSTAITNN